MKFYVLLVGLAVSKEVLHPVREDIVDRIKLKTSSWTPKEV